MPVRDRVIRIRLDTHQEKSTSICECLINTESDIINCLEKD